MHQEIYDQVRYKVRKLARKVIELDVGGRYNDSRDRVTRNVTEMDVHEEKNERSTNLCKYQTNVADPFIGYQVVQSTNSKIQIEEN
jgi:hypothetical protein